MDRIVKRTMYRWNDGSSRRNRRPKPYQIHRRTDRRRQRERMTVEHLVRGVYVSERDYWEIIVSETNKSRVPPDARLNDLATHLVQHLLALINQLICQHYE